MNLDASPFRLPPSDYSDALNITRDSQSDSFDNVVSNILGNTLVDYHLPSGVNKRIGSRADVIRNRIYYFVWNSQGYHSVLYLDANTNSIVKLIQNLTDSNNVDILNFNPSFRINHIDIIYRDEGDLLSWTDGFSTPKEINVTKILANAYGVLQVNFIEAAKEPPLTPPTAKYGTDTTINSNALRKKLFQFSEGFVYDSFAKSTPSAFSKIALPIGYYGSDNDTDNNTNNFITITIETGDKNVTDLEIYMRYNIEDAWSDFVLVIKLNKAQLNIPDNSTYQYLFYNDNIYPAPTGNFQYVDGVQSVPLFDWIPPKALCQAQPNGNYKVYSGITENYDNYPTNQLNVTITAQNETNAPPDTNPPSITYTQLAQEFTFTVNGTVPVGTNYKIYIFFNGTPPSQTFGVRLVAQYTSVFGDTINSVAFALYTAMGAFSANPPIILGAYSGNFWNVNFGSAGSYVFQIVIVAGGAGGGTISTEKTWLWQCNYIFGLVYFDEQNRDMPGVLTFTNPINSDNDFSVTTPQFSEDSGSPQTPVISAAINHLPPIGAVEYCWVRRRQTFDTVLQYMTCDFQQDTDYMYFCLYNIDKYKLQNSQFIYATAPITPESRLLVMAGVTTNAYDGNVWTANNDYQIQGVVTRTLTGGSSPTDDKPFIKVARPAATITPAYQPLMLVQIYTPTTNPTNDADAVYWEWGETYGIYELGGVHYHRGQQQDQTGSQPATFIWEEGDVYFHERTMYTDGFDTGTSTTMVAVMDENFSDFFNSAVNDNGRAQVIAANARKQFNPVLNRFSEAYQFGTSVNGLNRFYPENFTENDRSWGTVYKLYVDQKIMYVGQEFNVGIIPIFQQIVTDTAGNPLQADSEILLNKVQYPYGKQFGIGNVPESWAYGKSGIYGVDNNKGVVWRIGANGMENISFLYQCNAFFVSELKAYKSTLNNGNPPNGGVYTGNATVYGVFDSNTNKYIIALEQIDRYNSQGYPIFHQDPTTLVFLETRDEDEGFESKYSYHPEGMDSLNNLLVTFSNGQIWRHDNNTLYCNFYGVQYATYIEGIFNDGALEKKTWEAVTQVSNTIWECPVISTNVNSYGSVKQQSLLIEQDFTLFEDMPSAGFLRDLNSIGGLLNGDYLKGSYVIIRFLKQDARSLVILNAVSVLIKDSALTAK